MKRKPLCVIVALAITILILVNLVTFAKCDTNTTYDWQQMYARTFALINTTQQWGYLCHTNDSPVGTGWNGRFAETLLGFAIDLGTNVQLAESDFYSVYNRNVAAGNIGMATFIRNLPEYNNIFLLGGDPSTPNDLFYFTYANKRLGLNLDIPTATEMYEGWPTVTPNYFGTGYGILASGLNKNGSINLNSGFALNKALSSMACWLMTAELNNETNFYPIVKGFLDAWFAKYNSFLIEPPQVYKPDAIPTAESCDPHGESFPQEYYYMSFKMMALCIMVSELYRLGIISDTELASTYLPQLDHRIWELENVDFTGASYRIDPACFWGCYEEVLVSETLYHSMAGGNIPDNLCHVTLTSMLNDANNVTSYLDACEYLWRMQPQNANWISVPEYPNIAISLFLVMSTILIAVLSHKKRT